MLRLRNKLAAVASLALGVAALGCGYDCDDACEDANECDPGDRRDCPEYCENLEAVLDSSGCADRYDALLECADSQSDDVCDAYEGDACDTENKAYTECINAYCSANQGACKDLD